MNTDEELCLWGLTLSMVLDLVAQMKIPFPLQLSALPSPNGFIGAETILAPSMT